MANDKKKSCVVYTKSKRGKRKYDKVWRAGSYTAGMVTRPYNNLSYMPQSFRTVHRYVQVLTYDASSLTGVPYVFSGNSLYDPFVTGTGHQPGGFDKLAAIYRKYMVTSSKMDLKVMWEPASDSAPTPGTPREAGLAVYIIPSIADLTTEITALTDTGYRENPGTMMKLLPNNAEPLEMTYYKKTADVIGFRTLYDRTYYGENGANPGSQWYWNLGFVPLTAQLTGLATIYVDITYYTMWADPIDYSNS